MVKDGGSLTVAHAPGVAPGHDGGTTRRANFVCVVVGEPYPLGEPLVDVRGDGQVPVAGGRSKACKYQPC